MGVRQALCSVPGELNCPLGVGLNASPAPDYAAVREIKMCENCGRQFTRRKPEIRALAEKYCRICEASFAKATEPVPAEMLGDQAKQIRCSEGARKRWENYRQQRKPA